MPVQTTGFTNLRTVADLRQLHRRRLRAVHRQGLVVKTTKTKFPQAENGSVLGDQVTYYCPQIFDITYDDFQ